jgi:iron(III) transport system permease protein
VSRGALAPPRPLVWAAAATALIALAPMAYLLARVAEAGPSQVLGALLRERTFQTTATSLALALAVVACCLALGLPMAWILSRTQVPLRAAWLVIASLPLAIPSYVAAYAWLAQFPAMHGFWAATLVLTLVSLPYVVLPVTASLRTIDPAGEEIARTLGRGPARAFAQATLPQAWPAAAAGSLLVALYVLSDFGAVALLRVDAFSRVIYASYRASFDRTSAAVLAVVLVGLAAALVLLERRVRGRGLRYRVSSGAARKPVPMALTWPASIAAISFLSIVAVAAIGFPVVSLLLRMAERTRRGLDVTELLQAVMNSAGVALLGAIVALGLALPVASLAARYRGRAVSAIETASYAGHALPGVVVGLSLVFLTLGLLPFAYQTLVTLAFAYAVLFLPKAIGSSRAAIAAVPPVIEQAARTLGRSHLKAWLSTTARIAWPGIAAGGLLVLLTAMKELPATLMLRPTGLDTLATELWSRTEVAAYGAAAPYALALIALAAVPAWLLSTAVQRERPSTEAVPA